MARIYISSTFVDLKEHRAKVIETLGQLGHEVVSMERYVTEDRIPLEKCLEDVDSCEIYVGIFAWRYGSASGKETDLSITEREYRRAEEKGIPRLVFLLDESAPWPPAFIDAFTGEGKSGRRVRAFRKALKERLVSFFTTPDDLARTVGVAVSLEVARAWLQPLKNAESLAAVARAPLGSSLTPDIMEAIEGLMRAKDTRVLDIDLRDGKYWWSTRLFLVAALAVENTSVDCLAFLTEGRLFFGLATPVAVLNALSKNFPHVAQAYYRTLRPPNANWDPAEEVVSRVNDFSCELGGFAGGEEGSKTLVTPLLLERWLGNDLIRNGVEIVSDALGPREAHELLNHRFGYVALLRKTRLVGVVDRVALATNLARGALEARMGKP